MQKKRAFWIIGFGLFSLLIFFMNSRMIYITDDWHFKFVFEDFLPTASTRRISGISDIVESMKNYYLGSGGRVLAHTILQFLLMFDKIIFNVLNTFVFLGFGYLIYRLSVPEKKVNRYLVFVYILIMFYIPLFGETCLWMSGAVNYLWVTMIILSYLHCVKNDKRVLSIILAFFSGFTNEATGGILIVFMIMQILFKKEKLNRINIFRMLMLISGEIFILLSPGNMIRADEISKTKVFSIDVTLEKLMETFSWIISDGYYILILPVLVICLIYRKQIKKFADPLSYLVASFAGMGALALSGTFIIRAHFLNVVFLIISFVSAVRVLSEIIKEKKAEEYTGILKQFYEKRKTIKITALSLVVLFILGFGGMNMYQFIDATGEDQKQINMIEEKAALKEDFEYTPVMHYDAGLFYPGEAVHSKEYEAEWQSSYYGIDIKVDVIE